MYNKMYEINPCKACLKEAERTGDYNINTLNSCLMNTIGAFSSYPSRNAVSYDSLCAWQDCVKEKMAEMGRTPCDFRLNTAPVFVDTPHHFPELVQKCSPDEAYEKCVEMCKECPCKQGECQKACQIDRWAICDNFPKKESFTKEDFNMPSIIGRNPLTQGANRVMNRTRQKSAQKNGPPAPTNEPPKPPPTFKDVAKDQPVAFWTTFSVVAVILALLLTIFLYIIFSNDVGTSV